jgi:hypothetical protein
MLLVALTTEPYNQLSEHKACILSCATFFFFWKDPVYLQSVIIHSANGGMGEE